MQFFLIFQSGFEVISDSLSGTDCTDQDSASKGIGALHALALGNTLWLQLCPLPCNLTTYDAKIDRHHINNLVGFDEKVVNAIKNHSFLFGIAYETLAVHENVETLLVDTPNFLSQIGGHLGLFLGVSCLSVVTGIIKFSKHTLKCWKTKH